ncbi:peptidoglycan editing factor PgeF [Caldimonas brevitalea]|nr:peptidoglycan editing factor PgeF [Caldimonas brevitalea]
MSHPVEEADWLRPAWPAPQGVGAVMSLRTGGYSVGPYGSFNLGSHVGDDASAVERNRERFARATGARPVFLNQVHGTEVVRLGRDTPSGVEPMRADACYTTEPGIACTVLVADCLPVLFAASGARGVAAAHAGWRGLAGGVLENTVAALCQAAECRPSDLVAWLGACIGPAHFEVGDDVRQAFGGDLAAARFTPGVAPGKWWADLAGLAFDRLHGLGLARVTGGQWCTYRESSRFFSFRRDGVTGRMAAAVWCVRDGG